jgi:hypothetical protein
MTNIAQGVSKVLQSFFKIENLRENELMSTISELENLSQ